MNHWAMFVLAAAVSLMWVLQGCRSSNETTSVSSTAQIPEWAKSEERANIVGTLTSQNGDRFKERVTATVTQGTSTKSITVESGEYRIDGLLAGVACGLTFTSKENEPIGRIDQMKLIGGDNEVGCAVDKLPSGKFRFVPRIKIPSGVETGPTK
jgi:hypothetical protein